MPVISTIAAATARAFGAFKSLGGAADEFFDYVTLLLHGDGTNGAQNNTFLDSSTNNFTITRNGNTTQGTFSPFSQDDGKWGAYFDGSGDYLTAPVSAISSVGSGSFSIECWVYATRQTNTYAQGLVSYGIAGSTSGTSYLSFQLSGSGYLGVAYAVGNAILIADSELFPLNQWVHAVVCRSGSTISLFVNGTRKATTTTSATVGSTGNVLGIGGQWFSNDAGRQLQGSLSNVRIVVGSSAYDPTQTTITVPTTPLTAITNTSLLTCQSNRFKDNSANAFAITVNGNTSIQPFSPFAPSAAYSAATNGGSGYFDGSGDYLSLADNAAFAMGTGNFTAEFWIYTQDQTNNYPGIISGSIYNDTGVISVRYDNTGHAKKIFVYLFGASPSDPAVTSSAYEFGQWIHVAIIRDSSTSLKVYVNGVLDGTATISAGQQVDFSGANSFYVGRGFDIDGNAGYYAGYISNVRLVKGQALASGNFTPPSAPVTSSAVGWTGANAAASITGTVSFVSNFTNGGIFDNTAKNVLETVGNAQISTSVKKFGTGSLAFDETGDYLQMNGGQNFVFGTGDFTIEGWVYLTNTGTFRHIYDSRPASTDGAYPTLRINESNAMEYIANSAVRITSSALSQTTWYHFALCRSNTSTKLFINGTQAGSTYTDSTNYLNATNRPFVGGSGFHVTTLPFTGYIDDFRITKGIARYTSAFTPPAAAFADQ